MTTVTSAHPLRSTTTPRGRTTTILLWVLQVVAAAAFVAAGSFKLTGNPMMVAIFEHIGVGQWFRFVTGAIEVACGLALLIPAVAAFGAAILAITMACAVFTHLAVIGGNPAPAIALMLITGTIAWLRRDRIRSLVG